MPRGASQSLEGSQCHNSEKTLNISRPPKGYKRVTHHNVSISFPHCFVDFCALFSISLPKKIWDIWFCQDRVWIICMPYQCQFSIIFKILKNQLIKLSNSWRVNQRKVSICFIVSSLKCMYLLCTVETSKSFGSWFSLQMVRVVSLGFAACRATIIRLPPC